MIEKKKPAVITLRLDPDDYAVFSGLCALNKDTVTDVLRGCIAEYIDKHKSMLNPDMLKTSEARK